MGKVATGFSTSLEGFIAGPNGDVGPLFDWYFAGDTDYTVPGGRFTLTRVSNSGTIDPHGSEAALVSL